jgi:ribonuclease HI
MNLEFDDHPPIPSGADEESERIAKTEVIDIYVDGACEPNPGKGGWGVHIPSYDPPEELSGSDSFSTNQKMELTAAIIALEIMPEGSHIRLHSDSTYVVNGITKWIHGWKNKGWKNANKKPVANKDLWERLEAASQRHTVEWIWVRGHSGIEGNERADALANDACRAQT